MSFLIRSRFLPLRLACLMALLSAHVMSPSAAFADGHVTRELAMPSQALGRPVPYAIYQPGRTPGSSQQRGEVRRKLPVLYLLHGHGDNETAWLRHGQIARTLDRLIAARRIAPLMVVMPMAGNSWYVDDARGKAGFGPVARALMSDFVAGIDARYPTDACRGRRAIGGLSMGGFGAVLYAFDHPDKFAAAISLSGSLFAYNLSSNPARRLRLSRLFRGVYGEPFDMRRFNSWNVFGRVAKVAAMRKPPAVWLAAGDDDFPAILKGTVDLHLALKRRGVATELRIDDAGHTWRYWRAAIAPALEWLSPQLSRPCERAPAEPQARQDTATQH